jgi:hypothetical protein
MRYCEDQAVHFDSPIPVDAAASPLEFELALVSEPVQTEILFHPLTWRATVIFDDEVRIMEGVWFEPPSTGPPPRTALQPLNFPGPLGVMR